MKMFSALILFGCMTAGYKALGVERTGDSPILLELFTSEGCSSCPPVDSWIQKLDASQPVEGAQLIVLSEHVDYWNHDGWKDPYSSSLLTERQSSYARALGLSDVYTPQVIVDGTAELHLSNPQAASQILSIAAATRKIGVRIESAGVTGGIVRARIETDANSAGHKADVFVAIALNHAESEVLRGENGGKRLTHVAVAQSVKKIGSLKAGENFSGDFEMKVKAGTDPANLGIVVFIQEAGPGRVLGAALQRL